MGIVNIISGFQAHQWVFVIMQHHPAVSFLHKVIVVRASTLNNKEYHYQNPAITCSGMYFLFLDKHRKPKTRKKSLIAILTQPKIFQQQIRIQKIILFNMHKNRNYKVKKIILDHTSQNNQTVTQLSDVQQLLVHVTHLPQNVSLAQQ